MDDKSLHQLHNEEINQKDGFKEVNNPDYYLGKKFYPSCQYLESGMVLGSNGINHCCGKISSEFSDNCVMEYDHTFEEDINLFLDKFIDEKKKVIKANCEGKETICTGCEYLKEGWWDEKKMIRSLNISFDNSCNFRCIYCYKVRNGIFMTHMERAEEDIIKKILSAEMVDI